MAAPRVMTGLKPAARPVRYELLVLATREG
jgi:hypothetical protein